jgi:hypothetical protein
LAIGNWKSKIFPNGWPTPAASLEFRESNAASGNHGLLIIQSRNEIYGLLLATFSKHSGPG